jgi:hypothetical protein
MFMKLTALAAVAAMLACTVAAQAADTPAVETDSAQARRVVRDKETGQLRAATASEAKAMADADKAAAGAQRPTQLVVRQHANGARSIALPMEMMSTLKAERQPSGALAITHGGADDAAHAAPVRDDRPTE